MNRSLAASAYTTAPLRGKAPGSGQGLIVLALLVGALIAHVGCARTADLSGPSLPRPPSEDLRSRLGEVRVTAGSSDPAWVFTAPAKGAVSGALRGAGLGAAGTIGVGLATLNPYGAAAGIVLAPLGAVVGAVAGAASAEPAARVEEKETALKKAMEELKFQKVISDCVATALREQIGQAAVAAAPAESASTILEVTVEKFGLDGPWRINPPLTFVMSEHTRLIRVSDDAGLYSHLLTYRGRTRPLDDWVAEGSAKLREEAGRACRDLAERLVDEVFLLYLLSEEPEWVRP